jgi:hypothetical protein
MDVTMRKAAKCAVGVNVPVVGIVFPPCPCQN